MIADKGEHDLELFGWKGCCCGLQGSQMGVWVLLGVWDWILYRILRL
jgi:hypothetical protein